MTVTVTITGSNDDPTGDDGTGAVTAGMDMAAMGNVNAMDADTGDTVTFAVGDAAAFGTLEVDEATGAWTYMLDNTNDDVKALDAGETMEDTGTVVITDGNDGTATVSVAITITGVNDAPDAPTATPSAANLTVAENDGSGVNLAQLTSSDPEGDDISYEVDNKEDFEIEVVGNAVLLKVKDGVELDYEATMDGTITLMVTASDGTNTSEATAVVVTVTDVNETPKISFDGSDGTQTLEPPTARLRFPPSKKTTWGLLAKS